MTFHALRRRRVRPAALALLLTACATSQPDAWGNFEATEVTIAAESPGRMLSVLPREGAAVDAGQLLAVVDTVALVLQRAELAARITAARARLPERSAAVRALVVQREVALREQRRTERLLAAQAATGTQADRAEREVRVLAEQVAGARAGQVTAAREVEALAAQAAQLDERLRRSAVVSPLVGTVLTRYVEPGEYVQPGAPLFKLAQLDTLLLRAYVDGATLPRLRVGDTVTVRVDEGRGGLRRLVGRLEWIAAKVEFTPTPIQTREERTTQVYAVKIRVPNADGTLKIGMPGELVIDAAP